MKFFLLIGLLAFACNASCKDYLDYYQAIARADAAAVHSAYSDALAIYDSAFAQAPYNNPADLYVAAQIAGFLNQPARASGYILKGISFGLPLQTAQANPHLQYAIAAMGSSLQQKADSCWQLYHHRINKTARRRMVELIRFDQGIVRNLPQGGIYNRKGRALKKEYVPVWDSLLRELVDMTIKWGFRHKRSLVHRRRRQPFPDRSRRCLCLFYHGASLQCLACAQRFAPGELRKGNITPQMYGAIADYSNGHDDYARMEYFAVRPCEAEVHSKRCREAITGRLDQINAARHQIGLCSYEVAALKLNSMAQYTSWVKSGAKDSRPLFDFQIHLNQW